MARPPASDVAATWAAAQDRVARAATAAGRAPDDVRILLATKTMPLEVVRAAVHAGATLLGENRVQELIDKAPGLADLSPELHVIGHLQSNTVAAALRWASCIQSIDSIDLAERLSRRSTGVGSRVDVMVQVNVSGEETKYGAAPEDAVGLARQVAELPGVRLTGFMTIGARADEAAVRRGFARLRAIRDEVLGSGEQATSDARQLSMGMSGDLEAAVAEGATIVRLGTAVFGERDR